MKKWILKAVIQKVISFMPASQSINYLFQKHVTKGVFLSQEYFEDKLIHTESHVKAFYSKKDSFENISTLELGTGWYPIVPICLFLHGAGKSYSADLNSLAKRENIVLALERIVEYHENGKLKEFLNRYDASKIDTLKNILSKIDQLSKQEILRMMNIELIVGDARQLPFQDDTFDLITSNNTFEHVYVGVLIDILKEFKRLSKPQGVMSHFIDMSDHFAHMDSSINIYNFLQFSEKQWNLIDNSVQPQNRLRIPQFRTIYKDLGISIDEEVNRPGSLDALSTISVSKEFEGMTKEEMAISHSLVISHM